MGGLTVNDLKREIAIIKRDLPTFEEYKAERKSAGDKAGAYYWQTKIEESKKRLKEVEDFIAMHSAKRKKPSPAKRKKPSPAKKKV